MPRMKMVSVKSHPACEALRLDYDRNPACGDYIAHLDHHAWGDHANLFSYFSVLETGYLFRLSTWQNRDYRPAGDGPAFDEEPVGGVFFLVVGATRNGLPKLLSAACMEKVPDELAYPQTLDAHYEQQRIAAAGQKLDHEPEKGVFFWPSGAPPLKGHQTTSTYNISSGDCPKQER